MISVKQNSPRQLWTSQALRPGCLDGDIMIMAKRNFPLYSIFIIYSIIYWESGMEM